MNWRLSHRADTNARVIADRHYNRQKPGARQFVPPGRCLVLLSRDESAFWVTSWPFGEYVKHAWPGAWMCSAFRNEGGFVSSELIREAISATRWEFGNPPPLGMVTFIDPRKVKPTIRRGKKIWGYCYWKAGFKYVTDKAGELILTKGGLIVMRIPPWRIPPAQEPLAFVGDLFRMVERGIHGE